MSDAPNRSCRAAVALGLFAAVVPMAAAQQPAASLVFDGVTVVDVEGGQLVPDQRVVIVGNRIKDMGATNAVKTRRARRS